MKKALIITGIVIVVIAAAALIGLKSMAVDPDDIIITEPDLSGVEDGMYVGEYVTTLVSARVVVTVQHNTIVDIEIMEHKCGMGKPAEAIVDDVLDSRSLQVDTVSGATLSSKVILKAVENAVTGN